MANKRVLLEDLLQGSGKRVGIYTLPEASELINPWLEQVTPLASEFHVETTEPEILTEKKAPQDDDLGVDVLTPTEIDERVFYPRVIIEAVLNEDYQHIFPARGSHDPDRFRTVMGMIYAMDIKEPVCKVYVGYERGACLNLSVFNPVDIMQRDLTSPDFQNIYTFAGKAIQRATQRKEELLRAYEVLVARTLQGPTLKEAIGDIAFKTVDNAGMLTHFTQMLQLISSPKSLRNIPNIYWNTSGVYSPYDLYQAFIASMDRDPASLPRPEKLLKAYEFFGN